MSVGSLNILIMAPPRTMKTDTFDTPVISVSELWLSVFVLVVTTVFVKDYGSNLMKCSH
jgi:hypothetical protein